MAQRPAQALVERRLGRGFFARHVLDVAQDLLGRVLVHDRGRARVAGRIVEVEAYRGLRDPASHAHRGRTPRAAVMFGPPATSYVYLSYGMHHCLNLVCEPDGEAAAVLVRALEPLLGLRSMRSRRPGAADHALARGPGCVGAALGVDLSHSGLDLVTGPLWVSAARPVREGRTVLAGPRIGIRRASGRPWRFHLAGHPSVSGPRRASRSRVATRQGREPR